MGLPVARTKVLIYTLNGFCSGLAGVVFTFYMLSGYALHCKDLHMDAIAATVMGGTLLTGGVGSIQGSIVGVLILGTIQTIVNFQGTLSSWWTRIVVGILIFAFILMQSLLNRPARTKSRKKSQEKERTAA
jgi:simple sugar transport system permease protein